MTVVVCDNCTHTHEPKTMPITPHACEKCGHGILTVQLPTGATQKLRVKTTSGENVEPITTDATPSKDDDDEPVVNPL